MTGMDDQTAAARGALSAVGGDLAYDGVNWMAGMSWDKANRFAKGTSLGRHTQELVDLLDDLPGDGTTFDNAGRGLDAILKNGRNVTAGQSSALAVQP